MVVDKAGVGEAMAAMSSPSERTANMGVGAIAAIQSPSERTANADMGDGKAIAAINRRMRERRLRTNTSRAGRKIVNMDKK
mgnify:FL=1